jgi:hypothetical protein
MGHVFRPSASEDQWRVARGFIQSTLGGLYDIDRCFPAERFLRFLVVQTSVAGYYDLRETGRCCRVAGLEFA